MGDVQAEERWREEIVFFFLSLQIYKKKKSKRDKRFCDPPAPKVKKKRSLLFDFFL